MAFKREKWSRLVVNSGFDRYAVPIFSACAGSRKVPLLKTLISSHCQNNCKFCAIRCEEKVTREKWEPEELANVTLKLWKFGKIKGLFLSSSVERDPDYVVEKEIETVEILRRKGFTAYTHLRLMPGTDIELIKQSVEIADRVGINIEFPSKDHYNDMKIFLDFNQDIIKRLKFISRQVKKAQKEGNCKAGMDTQMVVGASDETDKQILDISEWMYKKLNARRVYYSAFQPMKNTPLEKKPAESKWREYRLYQCSFLIQKYNFCSKDFVLDSSDKLPINQDPKLMIAKKLDLKVDINNCKYEELIKIPGVGIKTARSILQNRPIKTSQQLKKLGVLSRAHQFIDFKREVQTSLNFWK
jgi:predicted DNA-binding helix-hairpin-helix protein